MKWLYEHHQYEPEPLNEPLIDCTSCSIHASLTRSEEYSKAFKCCEFTPFWGAFAIGAWIEEGGSLVDLIEPMALKPVLTILGIMHPISKRREKKSLCQFYNKAQENCSIWLQRPATCSTFYCTSSYKKGGETYSALEDSLLKEEADLLLLWFIENKGEMVLWTQWCQYMEKETALDEVDPKMILSDLEHAKRHYTKSYQWLKEQSRHPLINENIKKQLEQISQLC